MSNIIDITNKSALHFSINSIARVKEICKPLQSNFGISLFGYFKLYSDCSYIELMNGYEEFQTKFFTNTKTLDEQFKKSTRNISYNGPNFTLWPTKFEKLPPIISLHNEYNFWYGFSIAYRYNDYCEAFFFTFDKNSGDKAEFYFQNATLLVKFCDYFKNQAADLIDDSDKRKFAVFNEKFDTSYDTELASRRSEFFNEINSPILYLTDRYGQLVKLTHRESECIKIMMQNRTVKEIAKSLDLSPKTVESHINHIKQKLNINNKSQLVDAFFNKYNYSNLVIEKSLMK